MSIGFGSSKTAIGIELDRGDAPYYPGDVIEAAVTVSSDQEIKIRAFRVGLLAWEIVISEDSDGDRNKWTTLNEFVAEEVLLEDQTLAAGFRGSYQVALPIPPNAFPPYYSSDIQSGWFVKATLERGMKRDVNEQVEVPLVVPPPGEKVQAGEYAEASHPKDAEMRLWLPRLEWIEGETVEGKLTVVPRSSFDASEVRIGLNRQQKAHTSRLKKTASDSIDRVQLAGKTKFQPGQTLEYPFSFPLPTMGCPTRRTESTTVVYTLQAALSRRWRKDYTVGTEIFLYSGPGPG